MVIYSFNGKPYCTSLEHVVIPFSEAERYISNGNVPVSNRSKVYVSIVVVADSFDFISFEIIIYRF